MTFFSRFKEFHQRRLSQRFSPRGQSWVALLSLVLSSLVTAATTMAIALLFSLLGFSDFSSFHGSALAASWTDAAGGPTMASTVESSLGSELGTDFEQSALSESLAGLDSAGLVSYLPPGNAITDGRALLRYSLPIDNKPIRKVQGQIEEISNLLRVQGSRPLSSVKRNISLTERILSKPEKILEAVSEDRQAEAKSLLGQVDEGIADLLGYVEAGDRNAIYPKRLEILDAIGNIEQLMVKEFPFEIPEEYDALPRLLGRATVEMDTDYGKTTIVLDGYSAPLTAGNFLDLVQRKFYDGLEFNRVEDFYVVQAGDPKGSDTGFIDPDTGQERTVPLEVLVQGDEEPLYGFTMEQMGITLDDPVLPFSAFGTLAMARPDRDVNGGSSQFFFLKFQTEMTPAGINMLDGEYAVFGYAVKNKEIIDKFRVGDRIKSIRVIDGTENFKAHA